MAGNLSQARESDPKEKTWVTDLFRLDGELAAAEPKKLRYRILHVAARITQGGRHLRLRISATWPWRHELSAAFHRLAALPRPAD